MGEKEQEQTEEQGEPESTEKPMLGISADWEEPSYW